jgi:4-amino-4-deoxy-L-arabinose transferase-like glycosyltransferase
MDSWFTKLAARPVRSILWLSLLLLLAGNWILPLTDRDETRFAEASREMLQRADYVVPWFNGHWRFDKPILIYWCQAASYLVLGENAFAARLPSVLFTTATALLLVLWGRRVADNRTGFIAGGMFLAGLHIAIIGRVATADMAMVFFYAVAVWSGWELTRPRTEFWKFWWLLLYVALGLGFLAKGPIAWIPIGGLVLARILWNRPVKRTIDNPTAPPLAENQFRLPILETIVGLALAGGLAALWAVPALTQTHGQYFYVGMGEHVFHRSTGIIDGHGLKGLGGFILQMPLYFVTFFVSFFPWSTRVPGALRRWWPGRRLDPLGWYLLLQALAVFVIFSLVRTKLPHYTLPAFPCIALWLALQLRPDAAALAWFQTRFLAVAVAVLVLMLGGSAIAQHYILTENLWTAVRPHMQPDTKVGCFGFTESSLVWKFRAVTTNLVVLDEEKQAAHFLTNAPPFILVLPSKDVAALHDTNDLQIDVHGLDMVKVRNWNLTIIMR